MDKPSWREREDHPFSRNGLFHNPRRSYGKQSRNWPKKAWYSARLLASEVQTPASPYRLEHPWSGPSQVFTCFHWVAA